MNHPQRVTIIIYALSIATLCVNAQNESSFTPLKDSLSFVKKRKMAKEMVYTRNSNGYKLTSFLLKEAKRMGLKREEARVYQIMGDYYIYQRKIDSSIMFYEVGLELSRDFKDREGRELIITFWAHMSEAYRFMPDYQNAILFARNSIQELNKFTDEKRLALGIQTPLNVLAVAYDQLGEYDSAIYYNHLAYGYTIQLINPTKPYYPEIYLIRLARISKELGLFKDALCYYNQAEELCNEYDEDRWLSTIIDYRGTLFFEMGDMDKGLDEYNKALEVNILNKDTFGQIANLVSLAVALDRLENENKSEIIHFKRAQKLSIAIKNDDWTHVLNGYLSFCYSAEKQEDTALLLAHKALHFFQERSNTQKIAWLNSALGTIHLNACSYDSAVYYQRLSLKSWGANSDFRVKTYSLGKLAEALIALGSYREAISILQESLTLSRKANYKKQLEANYRLLAKVFKEKQDYKKALEYYVLFDSIKSAANSNSFRSQIANMEIKYEVEKLQREKVEKEKEALENYSERNWAFFILYLVIIVFLFLCILFVIYLRIKHQKRMREEQERLKEQETERTILKERYHAVKNSFEPIILNIENIIEETNDARISQALKSLKTRASASEAIYKQLQGQNDANEVLMQEYLDLLCSRVTSTFQTPRKRIICTVNANDLTFEPEIARKLGRITNEIITNAYQHAYKNLDKGEITINLNDHPQKPLLEIFDNGNGYPDGFELQEKSISSGTELIRILARQINAAPKYYNNAGARFELHKVNSNGKV